MITVVLYGRNDSYGYNLHKRAALSLNCMAEVLTDPADEIIFVDYNTPDDYPTFPEAIEDMLTVRAQRMLRILRVRPSLHARFKTRSHLQALEPIARNIAIRRSSPANRWILSTNTDMIFVPRGSASLSDLARDLPTGLYHLPRFEIPESLWEGFDRLDAAGTIAAVRHWGEAAHLNEIVRMPPYIRFDGPGDFQLMERNEIFAIHGFHETMLSGWHVDSNLAKRFFLRYGKTGDLVEHMFGYHCDHTRQVTPAHSHVRLSNSIEEFVDQVASSEIPEQADSWGCPADEIEEIALADSAGRRYARAIEKVIPQPILRPSETAYVRELYDKVDYDPRHVLPFLLDIFANAPRRLKIGWHGNRAETFRLFTAAWKELDLNGEILLDAASMQYIDAQDLTGVAIKNRSEWLAEADAFILDFGFPENDRTAETARNECLTTFFDVVRAEHARAAKKRPPRRVVGVNVVHNRFETAMRWHLSAAATPFSTRIRQGYVLPAPDGPVDWLPRMFVGVAGQRVGTAIVSRRGVEDWIFYGPYAYLSEGRYRLQIGFGKADRPYGLSRWPLLSEVCVGNRVLACQFLSWRAIATGSATLEFEVNRNHLREFLFTGIDFRMRARGMIDVTVQSARCQRIGDAVLPEPRAGQSDWLPVLRAGKGATHRETCIRSFGMPNEYIFFGPHGTLPSGRYRVTMKLRLRLVSRLTLRYATKLWLGLSPGPFAPAFIFEIVDREMVIAHRVLTLRNLLAGVTTLDFEISDEFARDPRAAIECRLRGLSEVGTIVRAITCERIGDVVDAQASESVPIDWLPLLRVGPAGRRAGDEICTQSGAEGVVFYGPYWRLRSGCYQVELGLNVAAKGAPAIAFEIMDREKTLAHRRLSAAECAAGRAILGFEISRQLAMDERMRIECRMSTKAGVEATVHTLTLTHLDGRILVSQPPLGGEASRSATELEARVGD